MKISVETIVSAPLESVWHAWTRPEDIVQWNAASDDWQAILNHFALHVTSRSMQ